MYFSLHISQSLFPCFCYVDYVGYYGCVGITNRFVRQLWLEKFDIGDDEFGAKLLSSAAVDAVDLESFWMKNSELDLDRKSGEGGNIGEGGEGGAMGAKRVMRVFDHTENMNVTETVAFVARGTPTTWPELPEVRPVKYYI